MMNLVTVFNRVPKLVLFGTAGLIQIVLIGLMVADRVMILRTGVDVTLHTRPVDPRDFLRGDYVVLDYDISTVSTSFLGSDTTMPSSALKDSVGRYDTIFVKLAPNRDGFYEAISVHAVPIDVASPEVLIRGRVVGGVICGRDRCTFGTLRVRYGIERYFVPEGEGKTLENARNQRKLTVIAAVAPTGRAAIKRLMIDGQPVYDEPLF
jgi:uncharacterized membrane-anchored protein